MSSVQSSTPFSAPAELAAHTLEPDIDQRWSTWPAVTPTQRGPLPRPDWLVTTSAAFDTELGIVKTGKEADLFLIERAVPETHGCLLAAKRFRNAHNSDFHRSSVYEEGRSIRDTREARAIKRKTAYGRMVAAGHWAATEFGALCRAWEAGVPVPYPVQVNDTEVLMEFIGTGRVAAPRLAQSRRKGAALRDAYEQVVDILEGFARMGYVHGDLSAYNLLDDGERIVVIDLPQVIDVAANPLGFDFLQRDVVNIAEWFTRRGLEVDQEALFSDVMAQLW
ncbi:MAG TPA: serine/threonine protein kinase [Candidatus Agrococcus pullicola]|uniref:non-specific serine/threonine protein kinase n=1 Tax=Candidatus Agrococcus pullicola TaxID=2838429 RepID=A0A9D1YUU0_9MICO|nr:serine/threonine protein kinase [Candidatus Agrococcus pullicola]